MSAELFWDATYAIALMLINTHPDIDPTSIGVWELAELVEALPQFMDDPALANERILLDIQLVWYEEKTNT